MPNESDETPLPDPPELHSTVRVECEWCRLHGQTGYIHEHFEEIGEKNKRGRMSWVMFPDRIRFPFYPDELIVEETDAS